MGTSYMDKLRAQWDAEAGIVKPAVTPIEQPVVITTQEIKQVRRKSKAK